MITIPDPLLATVRLLLPLPQLPRISTNSPQAKHLRTVPHHIYTLYLFTAADFPTFAVPTTLFALFASLSGPHLTTNPQPALLPTLTRVPLALAVTWANLLLFNISNQRSPTAVEEDRVNKPARPLPAGRLSCNSARRLLLYLAPAVMLLSWAMGVWEECLLQLAFTWVYNDLGGCDEHWLLRNALIALGYGFYSSAALRVMAGPEHTVTPQGLRWIGVVTAIMFATQHICDIKDAAGDALRGRQSAPIVLGDTVVRWSVAVPILLSSNFCAWYFASGLPAYVATLGLGLLVAFRILAYRDLKSDKKTWKLWALWTVGLFALPLVTNPAVFERTWVDLRVALWEVKCLLCEGERCEMLDLAAVSGIAMVFEGRRMYAQGLGAAGNGSVPEIVVESVVRST
ncbi:uncharacterized protein CC84DRAFT_1141313 [Paraphaeosphaeria sporulosa]|uniref:UbiA prenyltransferase n=1 Tax=Paraphaeosphaeria sporulosa TaxID=1460663 RepID=A0A177CNQ3_9PLEO|nr:uncharacterized protein CC84DRAFT_1141313 [Paraphaeosphaeria sporulosa]OAG08520.1 hypothetical protein CC84DRAFT_1141313 [Paraphaeosphaeria sporulosa]